MIVGNVKNAAGDNIAIDDLVYRSNKIIKSQDDLNKPDQHSTDVLIKALEKCERLEKQLKIAVEYLQWIYKDTKGGHIQCDACNYTIECEGCINQYWAEQALKQIKELDK